MELSYNFTNHIDPEKYARRWGLVMRCYIWVPTSRLLGQSYPLNCRWSNPQSCGHGTDLLILTPIASFIGQHGTHPGPTGPRWASCWPHEFCCLGSQSQLIKCQWSNHEKYGLVYDTNRYNTLSMTTTVWNNECAFCMVHVQINTFSKLI